MSSNLESILKTIQTEKDLNVKPENIRYGTKIFDVHGSLKPVTLNGGDSSMAIYLQDETPVLPEGIWINTDKTYENIYLEDELHTSQHSIVFSNNLTDDDSNMIKGRTVPEALLYSTHCQRGNKFHIFGYYNSTSDSNTTTRIHMHYTYDYDTDTWVKLSDCPTPQGGAAAEWIDDDTIYIFGSRHTGYGLYAYKYTVSTDTWERLDDISAEGYNTGFTTCSCYDRDNNCIYIGNYRTLYKYDMLTGTYSKIFRYSDTQYYLTSSVSKNNMCIYNNCIIIVYMYSNYAYIRCYDITNGTMSSVTTSAAGYSYIHTALGTNIVYPLVVGNRLYLVPAGGNSSNKVLYGSLSNLPTSIVFSAIPNNSSFSSYSLTSNYPLGVITTSEGVDILLNFHGTSGTNMKALRLYDKEYNFDKNTLLIYGNNSGQYKTQFYINQKIINDARWCQTFANVYLYDAENTTMLKTLPRYYGDGTNWIQIQ